MNAWRRLVFWCAPDWDSRHGAFGLVAMLIKTFPPCATSQEDEIVMRQAGCRHIIEQDLMARMAQERAFVRILNGER